MKFQGRGNTYLAVLDGDLNAGPWVYKLCTDEIGFAPKVDSFSHQNKCGSVDVEDARGIKSQTAEVTVVLADMEAKNFALGIFGTVNAAANSPTVVTGEVLPAGVADGDFYFLGGKTRHRHCTSIVVHDSSTVPQTVTLTSDYTVEDAERGLLKFLDVSGYVQPFTVNYSHTDPEAVSIFTAGQREFFLCYEYINKMDANAKGSLELYRVRFDPADNLDFQSDELQIMTLKGSALADTSRDVDDTELGQFGRRVDD